MSRIDTSASERYKGMLATLFCASGKDLTDEQRNELLMPFDIAIHKLSHGLLATEDFVTLVEMNAFAYELAGRLHSLSTNDETKALLAQSALDFHVCADRLVDMGERYKRLGKYAVKAEERTAVLTSMQWLEQLLNVTTEGHALKAMMLAEKNVMSALAKVS